MSRRPLAITIGKCLLAGVAFVALASLPARQIVPHWSTLQLAGFLGLLLLVLVGLAAAVAVVGANVNQFVLNKGGTDTQWLWFKQDPPGLLALRDKKQPEA